MSSRWHLQAYIDSVIGGLLGIVEGNAGGLGLLSAEAALQGVQSMIDFHRSVQSKISLVKLWVTVDAVRHRVIVDPGEQAKRNY